MITNPAHQQVAVVVVMQLHVQITANLSFSMSGISHCNNL
jgi:hypothetical protein